MRIVCVNPWVRDFACHDLFAKPYGLMLLATSLRNAGHDVTYVDLLDAARHDGSCRMARRSDGTGSIWREPLQVPDVLGFMERPYYRFGLPSGRAREMFGGMRKPDLILVTSVMTYWYTGVSETIALLKMSYPDVPVVLGGIYASLMPDHAAAHSGADRVVTGPADAFLRELGCSKPDALPDLPFLYEELPYIPVLTSRGCPFDCAYCASRRLQERFVPGDHRLCAEHVINATERFGTSVIAFYDDALLYRCQDHLYPLLDILEREDARYELHTPNGLHIRYIDDECARRLKSAGFKRLRLSLEYTEHPSGGGTAKTSGEDFVRAVNCLRGAGFDRNAIGVYLLAGMRGQSREQVARDVDFVYEAGGTPFIAEYSPVPGSPLFDADRAASTFDLSEPLLCNPSVFPMRSGMFTVADMAALKLYNRKQRQGPFSRA